VNAPAVSPVLAMCASALLFAVMAAVAKLAAAAVPGAEVAFFRFSLGTLVCLSVHLRRGLKPVNKRGLLLRGLFGGCAVLCYFISIEHLPVGIATLLQYTAPAFTTLFAAAALGERPGLALLGALALTLGGVALLVIGQTPPGTGLVASRWELVGMLGAIFSGAAVATIRMVRQTDGAWEIFTAFNAGGALITLLPTVRRFVPPAQPRTALLLLAAAAISVVAQLGMTWSLRWLKASTGGILMQLTPVGALAIGAAAFGERIHPVAWAGACVALLGVSWGAHLSASRSDTLPEEP
jgi:drug/metabolite transporter (DMT)-like permease